MIKTFNTNFLILFIIFIGASFIRISLDGVEYINNIIAFINSASVLYVFYLILENSADQFLNLLKNNNIFGEKIKIKKKKHFQKISRRIQVIILIIAIIYSLFWANPIVNDIIGFIALFLSIQTNYISKSIGNIFYKVK